MSPTMSAAPTMPSASRPGFSLSLDIVQAPCPISGSVLAPFRRDAADIHYMVQIATRRQFMARGQRYCQTRSAAQTQIRHEPVSVVEHRNPMPDKTWMADAPISKSVYAHSPALPKSARTDSKPTIVVTNRERVRLEKLRIEDQYDYEMEIDAADMLPPTWRHAGLPPDGTFTPKFPSNPQYQSRDQHSDYGGFSILAMAACNLVMRGAALSDNDPKHAEVKASLKLSKQRRGYVSLKDYEQPTITMKRWDELDEKRMVCVLAMLVRLFYRDYSETGDRHWREQELRKAVIMYMGGTGGTSQFANFTSLCMAMELAACFAESAGVRPDDGIHEDAARLRGGTIRDNDAAPAKPTSHLARVCRKILGGGVVSRVEEYPKLNNRLKHYGRDKDVEYFNSNVDKIMEITENLRADAAYVILLGLAKLYGTEDVPARVDENRRTSSVILGMVEDCVDRHGAGELDGGIEEKILKLGETVENEAVKADERMYGNAHGVLVTFVVLVKAAKILDAPDCTDHMRGFVRECEDILPVVWRPSKYEVVGEYTDMAMHAWLGNIVHEAVVWMDGKFVGVYERIHGMRYGGTSQVRGNSGVF